MNNILRISALLALLTLAGTLGFYFIESDWSLLDALYMTVITLTTVGYGEVHRLSTAGRVFVMIYLAAGLGVFLFGVVQLGELVVRAQLRNWMDRHRMDTALKTLENHFIVCGFGRMGTMVCRQLAARKVPFLAVDRDEAALKECREEGWPWLVGDATDDRTLLAAGIERARSLATVLGSDADNLFVVLSARLLSRDLQILARADDEKGAAKMEKAGASRVVSLYTTGATKITQLMVSPKLEDFIETFTAGGPELDLAEVQVDPGTGYAGKALAETDFRRRGIMIVGIRCAGGELLLPPPSSTVIRAGDVLIVLGKAGAIRELLERA